MKKLFDSIDDVYMRFLFWLEAKLSGEPIRKPIPVKVSKDDHPANPHN